MEDRSRTGEALERARLAALIAWPTLAAIALTVAIPERPDRTGHFVAGFGATLLAAWVAALASRGHALAIVAAVGACIGLGHLVEAHVFPLGGYDVLDVAAQSAGAVHAGLALLLGCAGCPEHDGFDAQALEPSGYGRLVLTVAGAALVIGTWRAFA